MDDKPAVAEVALAAERRQLTVMFCDLVDSTMLSTRLDPEILYELNRDFLTCCSDCVEEAGGYVAKYLGDGVLAYFGWPSALEDAARRALSAASRICERVRLLPTPHDALAVRIGIATGLVVVGELIERGSARERPITGEVPNMAARLQQQAQPNKVLVSDSTHRLAAHRFRFRDLGSLALKGFPEPVRAWELLGSSTAHAGRGLSGDNGPTEFVGRAGELGRIVDAWHETRNGGVCAVKIIGEAGIGKSRLIYELRRRLAREPHVWLEGNGERLFNNTPFYAVVQMLEHWVGRRELLAPHERLARLEKLLRRADIHDREAAALIADMLGLETRTVDAPLALPPDEKRRRLLPALIRCLLGTASRWPTVIVLDDAQWADPSTLELLAGIPTNDAGVRLLVVYAVRGERGAPPAEPVPRLEIDLQRLSEAAVRGLANSAGGGALESIDLESVVSRAGGVPLFAEELTRLIVAQGRARGGVEIPQSISDLLMARLDQLGPLKTIVQEASIFGGSFEPNLLAGVAELPETEVSSALDQLNNLKIIEWASGDSGTTATFRHALMRDAAYETLLTTRRRTLHRRAAMLIAAQDSLDGGSHPEVLAHHWTLASDFEQALDAWTRAARTAANRGAYKEAEHALEQAIALVEAGRVRVKDGVELHLQTAVAGVLQVTHGYASPEAAAATERARVLAERQGDAKRQFAHLAGEWMSASSGGDYGLSGPLAERLLPLARALDDVASLGIAHMALMTTRHRTGDQVGALDAFNQGGRYFASAAFRRRPGAVAQVHGNAGIIRWLFGEKTRVRRHARRILDYARGRDQPYELAFGQYMAGLLLVLLEDFEKAAELAGQAVRLADQHQFPQFAGVARVVLGRAKAEAGDPVQGAELADDGLGRMERSRNRAGITMYVAWRGEIDVRCGNLAGAIERFDEALTANPEERYYQPEILRLRSVARASRGDIAGARADVAAGLALAKQMGAKLLHIRLMDSVHDIAPT
jgi:class 3 adenylate cyclase/tetratricopeptide (TPR) repeat protein